MSSRVDCEASNKMNFFPSIHMHVEFQFHLSAKFISISTSPQIINWNKTIHLHSAADTENVCNQFSKANTQFDTIMDAAVAIDTTKVDAINSLFG